MPYHTNIWASGNVCPGNGMDDPGMWLYDAINFVGKLLQFQPGVINVHSPANPDAKTYWLKHQNDRDSRGHDLYPTDNRLFPVPGSTPEKPKMVIKKITRGS